MSNWIYSKNKDDSARYTLGERGKKNGRIIVCIGINPSTARPEKLDPTLTRVKAFAAQYNFDGWLMLNVYPQRATDPNDTHEELNAAFHKMNLSETAKELKNHQNVVIWASWGNVITKRKFFKSCLHDLAQVIGLDKDWIHLGELTKTGNPRHPLYLPYVSKINKFNIKKYLEDSV